MSYDSNCRAIVLSANGKHFTAGLDLMDAMKFGQELADFDDVARKANFLEQKIKAYQVWSMAKWYKLWNVYNGK